MLSQRTQELLERLETCLRDAAVLEVSPRCRYFAAQDVAVLAALIIAEREEGRIRWHARCDVLAYLRDHSFASTGLRAHVQKLARFDREDYDCTHCFTQSEANSALVSAARIYTALRWKLLEQYIAAG